MRPGGLIEQRAGDPVEKVRAELLPARCLALDRALGPTGTPGCRRGEAIRRAFAILANPRMLIAAKARLKIQSLINLLSVRDVSGTISHASFVKQLDKSSDQHCHYNVSQQ